MNRTKIDETAGDLFSAASGAEAPEPKVLIASPLVAETAGWLENRAKTLGSLLARSGRRPMLRPLNRCAESASRIGCVRSAFIRQTESRPASAVDVTRLLTIAAALSMSSWQRAWAEILIVDDERMIRAGLARLLSETVGLFNTVLTSEEYKSLYKLQQASL